MMRILLLNLGFASLEAAHSALAGQGYEIAEESGLTVQEVLELSPGGFGDGGNTFGPQLLWTDQTRPETDSIPKVVMIVHGGALERARALDPGTDDVISFPFDAAAFAARIRTQFRELAGAWCARWHDSIGGSLPARFADGWASSDRQRLRVRSEIDHHLNRRLRP